MICLLSLSCSLAQVGMLGISMGSYVESMWGVAQFSLPSETPCICAFVGDKNSVVGKKMDSKPLCPRVLCVDVSSCMHGWVFAQVFLHN